MDFDDIIYLCLLTFTIVFGYFFRVIRDPKKKKWISTGVGFLIVLFVSGIHTLHSVICTAVNAGLILYTSKRLCHIYSFVFSFLYLLFFRTTEYFGISYPPLHTNMIQMILTLKVVGVAFEIHDSFMEADFCKKNNSNIVEPSFLDIFHYIYCYIGVLTGPYYSYKTFSDYFKYDFYKYMNCDFIAKRRLTLVPVYSIIFLIITHYYPVKYTELDEFYTKTTFWYRLWYITPVFASFRMRMYVGLILSEAACIMAGLGAYPDITHPKPGNGPTINLDDLEKIDSDDSLKSKSTFNFDTVHNIETWHTEVDPLMKTSIKYWNMCVQYWMAYVVYKRFPIKSLRMLATFAVSALWHGVYAGYYLCLCFAPFYLIIEDIWSSLLRNNTTGMKRQILDVIFWIVRTQAFSYLGMAFSLLSMRNGLRYYGSVYFVYHITSMIGLGLGIALKNFTRKSKNDDDFRKGE